MSNRLIDFVVDLAVCLQAISDHSYVDVSIWQVHLRREGAEYHHFGTRHRLVDDTFQPVLGHYYSANAHSRNSCYSYVGET